MVNESFSSWMTSIQHNMETALDRFLPSAELAPQRLHEAMRYVTLQGGKRARPLLVFAAGELVGAQPEQLSRIASAVELIHVYSLVHDDMPCMDDDVLRRGRPTCHVAYDDATALLVGDTLQSLAFDLLSHPMDGVSAATQLAMVQLLAKCAGYAGMAGGQAIDLFSIGKQLNRVELEFMHMLKTGALIRASVLMGAQAGRSISRTDLDKLDHFAKCIGLAFQVVDDVLDCEADTSTLGKTAGKDAANDKPTYVSLMGLSEAKQFARELKDDAFDSLSGFGADAQRLRDLADYIVARSF